MTLNLDGGNCGVEHDGDHFVAQARAHPPEREPTRRALLERSRGVRAKAAADGLDRPGPQTRITAMAPGRAVSTLKKARR